jgi:phosphoglycerate dehydrogenase-like enzyme
VNTSRGKVIDQTALLDSLKNGKIAGADLDVFEEEPLDPENPLISMDNVVLTPHISSSSKESLMRMAVQVAEGVIEVLRGGVPENPLIV